MDGRRLGVPAAGGSSTSNLVHVNERRYQASVGGRCADSPDAGVGVVVPAADRGVIVRSFGPVVADPQPTMNDWSPRFERSIDQFESSDCSMDTGIFSYIIPATWQFHPCGQSPMNSQKPVQTQIRAPLPELRNYRFVLRGIASTDGCRTSGRRFRVR
jgi:hypothetical protein